VRTRIKLEDGSEQDVRIVFHHRKCEDGHPDVVRLERGVTVIKGVTFCEVRPVSAETLPEPPKPLAVAAAYCSISDNFCKETARRVALRKLLQTATFLPGESREALWRCYAQRSRG
jgi:hypothetical protein